MSMRTKTAPTTLPKRHRVAMGVNLRDLAESMSVAASVSQVIGTHARTPKFLDLGMPVKFARSQPMLPKTPNVLPKRLICQTCHTIRCLHKCVTIVHMPCLPALPSRAKLSTIASVLLKNMVTPHPEPIHFRKALFQAISKS